jgi:hypothetical protein
MPHESILKIRAHTYQAIYFIIHLGHKLKLGLILLPNAEEEKGNVLDSLLTLFIPFHILSVCLSNLSI